MQVHHRLPEHDACQKPQDSGAVNMTIEPIEIARINEARQAQALGELAHESVPLAGGFLAYSPGVPWINHAVGVALGTPLTSNDLDTLEAFYRERGVQPKLEFTVFAPEDTLALLAERGYYVEHFETVLALEIEPGFDATARLPDGRPEVLEIRRTNPGDMAACRVQSSLVGSFFHEGPLPEEMIVMGVRAIQHPRSVAFMAFIDGEPVAGCGMEIFEAAGAKVCSLWGTGVLEPYRRRGIQQTLIAHRLVYASKQGCRLAIIESKPGIPTERNAARLGFTLAYTRVCMALRET